MEQQLDVNENGIPRDENTSASRPGFRVAEIKTLDARTSSLIRKGQVITRILDVVRELVENSVDAEATSVQVFLFNYGLDKIEVRDNGHGIIPEEVQLAVRGGHTSKLEDTRFLSRGKCFGFRGEALNAMCSVGKVTVLTKTANNARATKYQLDALGNVISESYAPLNVGTVVTVERLFANYPVRRQQLQNKVKTCNDLTEIETYLKAVALGNPQVHLNLRHDSHLLWNKPAVLTIEQALITVLGHSIAKNMGKYGPVNVSVEDGEKDVRSSVERKIELYLPKKPVDMKTMSFTSNKMSMIFCNRKRVYIQEYEKLIHRYVTAVVQKQQPADQRRFPVFVLSITIPPNEADFNRDLDKTKVFLVHKDLIKDGIEEALSKFYNISIEDVENAKKKDKKSAPVEEDAVLNKEPESNQFSAADVPAPVISSVVTPTTSTSTRQNAIQTFLEDIPSESIAFIKSPSKPINSEPVAVTFPSSIPQSTLKHMHASTRISNFEISIDMDSQLTQQQPLNPHQQPKVVEKPVTSGVEAPSTRRSFEVMPGTSLDDWVEGRMRDKHGDIIQNVAIVTNQLPPSTKNSDYNTFRSLVAGSPVRGPRTPTDTCHAPPSKRARYPETPVSRSSFIPQRSPVPNYRSPFPSTPSPRPSHRQVTLESSTKWPTPTTVFSQNASNAIAGIRIPLTPNSRPIEKQTGGQRNSASPMEGLIKTAELYITPPPPLVQSPPIIDNNQPPAPAQSHPIASNRTKSFAVDWRPVKQFLSHPIPKLVPKIQEKLSIPSCVGPMYIAQSSDGIGVFSPTNMIKYFSSEIAFRARDSNNSHTLLNEEEVSSMFAEFIRRPELNKAAEAANIFHLMHDMSALAKLYSSMSLFHRG